MSTMECVRASFERLAVRGEAGLAWDEVESRALSGSTYESLLIKLNAKLEASVLLLGHHVQLGQFTVDVVVVEEAEQQQQESRGVLTFLQETLVGSTRPRSLNNNTNSQHKTETALTAAWDACRTKGYHSLYALAKITPDTLPDSPCREKYTAGQYAEALLGGCRAHFMFQRHHPLFEADALGLWAAGGAGCVSAVDTCYLVLAWQIDEQETATKLSPVSFFNTSTTPQRQGQKRTAAPQSEKSPIAPPRKRPKVQLPSQHLSPAAAPEEVEEEDHTVSKEQLPPPSPPKEPPPGRRTPGRPRASQTQAQVTPANQSRPSPVTPVPQPTPPPQVTEEAEDDLSDITFGFERPTPRGRGRGRGRASTATTPRKSVLLPQWSDEEKEELLQFFDTLNPSQTEQTSIALTCKFATMRFGRELPSKQLYQWVQQKNRVVHPRPDAYTLPGGDAEVHTTATEIYRSLNPDVSESKRVAFTCRFMQTQYGVELSSKKLFDILSGGSKKRGRRGR